MQLRPPLLSAFDPVASEEGGIDPFSLQATYEQLAERILPFITVRMARPRFLTAIAAGAVVCQRLRDEVAADRVTPAWLVYEWYVIESFVRRGSAAGADEGGRIPGIQKVTGRTPCRGARSPRRRISRHRGSSASPGSTGGSPRGCGSWTTTFALDDGGFELLACLGRRARPAQGFNGGLDREQARHFAGALEGAVEDGLKRGRTARDRWLG